MKKLAPFDCVECGEADRFGCRPGVCGARRRREAGIPITTTRQAPVSAVAPSGPRSYAFEILGPPVPLARGRAYLDDEQKVKVRSAAKSRAYAKKIKAHVLATLPASWPLASRFALDLRVYWPDAKRRDLSNVLKGLEDALNGIVWADDSQIDDLRVVGKIDREAPRLVAAVVTVEDR